MAVDRTNRGLARDRHGRGIRRPLPNKFFRPGDMRLGDFENAVRETSDWLRTNWPESLGGLRVVVLHTPRKITDAVQRFAFDAASQTIYLFRIPIQQFDVKRMGLGVELVVEMTIFEAAAAMLGIDKHDFFHPEDDTDED